MQKAKLLVNWRLLLQLILNGKHKSINNPSLDCGDYVIVINSKDIKVTGKKSEQKNLSSTFRTTWWIKNRDF